MDVQELLVATQAHLARSHERAQSVVLPASDHPSATEELGRARIDLEHVAVYVWSARVTADDLAASGRAVTGSSGRVGDVDLLGRQCVMVEEMTTSAVRHLRQARRRVGPDATVGFATGIDVAQHALAEVISAVRAAARTAHELARDPVTQAGDPAVQRLRSAQREHQDRSVSHLVGPRR